MGSKKEEAERVVFGVSDEKEALKSWGVKEKQRERELRSVRRDTHYS